MKNEAEYREAYEKIMNIYGRQFKLGDPLLDLIKVDQYGISYGEEFKNKYDGDIVKFAKDLENLLRR